MQFPLIAYYVELNMINQGRYSTVLFDWSSKTSKTYYIYIRTKWNTSGMIVF